MRFVANLRQETIDAFEQHELQLDAYLLSAHRVTPASLRAAGRLREQGIPLVADNGTKPLIEGVLDEFAPLAASVTDEVRRLRRQLGTTPRGRHVPEELRVRAASLAGAVVASCTELSEQRPSGEVLDAQLSMDPTHLIAQEDFATTCLIALGLERETTGWPVDTFDVRNRRSLRLWSHVTNDPRCADRAVYAVLAGVDYNTARSGGRLAARAGATRVAVGVASIASDRSTVDFFVDGNRSLRLSEPGPRRYVRLAQIASGVADGFADAGQPLVAFHGLGLGAPALFPLLAAALPPETEITIDATSPIHDAVRDRVHYDLERHGDRAETREIVTRVVEGGSWPLLSPFVQTFRDEFGHSEELARAWWVDQGEPVITRERLSTPSQLTSALPLFAEAELEVTRRAERTRIADNHWVLAQLTQQLPDGHGREAVALGHIQRMIDAGATIQSRGLEAALTVLAATGRAPTTAAA